MLRQPIVTILGHVDHGKTSLLDKIRGTGTAGREAGGITQAIGASIIHANTLNNVCGELFKKIKLILKIPGLLFIDTPGHSAFTNLRKRGGNLADIAILVVDINDGVMPQTLESIDILKTYKTPFVVAINKLDTIKGWKQHEGLVNSMAKQDNSVQGIFEGRVYTIIGSLGEKGFSADRFDRVSDYTQQVAVVPVSAKTGEGIPELLMVLSGLAQKFLEANLETDKKGSAKGTILEVKEQQGVGKVMDAIIYDGTLSVNDIVVIGGLEKPIVTKVKALFEPSELRDMREKRTPFKSVKTASASIGVRLACPDIEDVVAGMPLIAVGKDMSEEREKEEVQKQVSEVTIETEEEGVIAKADSLGSLEALLVLLKERKIQVKRASIGPVNKRDIADAVAMGNINSSFGVILVFNLSPPEPLPDNTKVIANDVIYRLIEDYEKWVVEKNKQVQLSELEVLIKPCKIQLLKGYIFRQSNPACMGAEVMLGTLKNNTPLMKADGEVLTTVKGLQMEQKNIASASKNARVAVSMPGVIVGRQIKEQDILFSAIPENDFRKYKDFKDQLSSDEKIILKEVAEIMRKKHPVWGI